MFQYIDNLKRDVVAFKITDSLTDSDSQQMEQLVAKRIKRFNKIRLLLVIKHYPSFNSAEDLYYDLSFARRFDDHIERMAVVGDRPWKHHWVALFGLFAGITCEYFDRSKFGTACHWITAK